MAYGYGTHRYSYKRYSWLTEWARQICVPHLGGDVGVPEAAALLFSGVSTPENIAAGVTFGVLAVTNVTGTPNYKLINTDGGRVALSGANVIRGVTAWDYETHPQVIFTVAVTGTIPGVATRTFVVGVLNVLDTALIPLSLSGSTILEGAPAGSIVGAIVGKTAGSTLTLLDDAGGRFAIWGTHIVTAAIPTDYETAASHTIIIRETHPDAASRDTSLAITVTDVVENALAALTLSASAILENSPAGTVVGAVIGNIAGSSLALVDDGGGHFALSGVNLVTTVVPTDYETAALHTIVIREINAAAANSPRDTALAITVVDVLGATLALLTLSASTILENTVAGAVVGAVQGKAVGSTLVLIDDAGGRFVLAGTNIVVGVVPTDYETATSHAIILRETLAEAPNSPRNTTLTITVTDVAEGPTLGALSLSANTVLENSPAGRLVGALIGQTPGSTLTLLNDAGGRFEINDPFLQPLTLPSNNVVENSPVGVLVGTLFGQTPGSTLTLLADAGGRFVIGDPFLPPLGVLSLSANTVLENSPAGVQIGAILGQTPGSTLTLVVDAGGRFDIGNQTLSPVVLSGASVVENSPAGVLVGAILGQTSGSTLELLDDAGGRFAMGNPALSALTLSPNAITENSGPGIVVGAIVGQTPGSTLMIIDDASGRFAIGG